jgi:uncharacterized damage-inducible protein DinB
MRANMFAELFLYDGWANEQALASLSLAGGTPAHALKIMAHIPAAQLIWMHRICEEPQTCPVWPEWSLSEVAGALEDLAGRWPRMLAGDLNGTVKYGNSQGEKFESRVEDVLQQLITHGAYHRGQIALLLRQGGFEPARTDYILAVRTGALHNT